MLEKSEVETKVTTWETGGEEAGLKILLAEDNLVNKRLIQAL